MVKQSCRSFGKERQQTTDAQDQQNAASNQNATTKLTLPTPGKQARLVIQNCKPVEEQASNQANSNTLESAAMDGDGLPPVPGGPIEATEEKSDPDAAMLEAVDDANHEAKEAAALNTLRESLDPKLLKQVENALQKKPKPVPDKQVARVQLAQQERALQKMKEERQKKKESLAAQLEEIDQELQQIESELRTAETARKQLDGPTPEEEAQQRAITQQHMFQQFDNAMELMRKAMLSEDWEAGADKHQDAYDKWKSEQPVVEGTAVPPLGTWYVTSVLMPRLAKGMMSGETILQPQKPAPLPQIPRRQPQCGTSERNKRAVSHDAAPRRGRSRSAHGEPSIA